MSPSGCLTDEEIAMLFGDLISIEERSSYLHHAHQCPRCLSLIGQAGLSLTGADPRAAPEALLMDLELPPSWTPPAQLDELRLQRRLGHGAMGVVYLAHDTSLDRPVAVKFISSSSTPGQATRERLRNEARAMARLRHPNVVTVHRIGELDGRPYLVSEYVDGQVLSSLPGPIHWRRALSLGLGLARGLAAVHGHGLLHRDLKPSNILVTGAGKR
jgi:serine/threonine protein kinase